MQFECNCKSCQDMDEFREHLKHVPEEHKEYFDNLYLRYYHASMDADVNQAIIEGSWPSSEEILESYRGYKMDTLAEVNKILKEKHGIEGLTIGGMTGGTNPNATVEQIADAIADSIKQLQTDYENGTLQEVDLDD